jgi:hypothetical protein
MPCLETPPNPPVPAHTPLCLQPIMIRLAWCVPSTVPVVAVRALPDCCLAPPSNMPPLLAQPHPTRPHHSTGGVLAVAQLRRRAPHSCPQTQTQTARAGTAGMPLNSYWHANVPVQRISFDPMQARLWHLQRGGRQGAAFSPRRRRHWLHPVSGQPASAWHGPSLERCHCCLVACPAVRLQRSTGLARELLRQRIDGHMSHHA